MAATRAPQRHQVRVRVWFGSHVIADYRADAGLADRYAAAMGRRFAGLRITYEPIEPDAWQPAVPGAPLPDLPSNQLLWSLTAL